MSYLAMDFDLMDARLYPALGKCYKKLIFHMKYNNFTTFESLYSYAELVLDFLYTYKNQSHTTDDNMPASFILSINSTIIPGET